MREPERIDRITDKIRELWKKHPDWRLNQLVVNVGRTHGMDPFYMEDDKFEDLLDRQLKKAE